MKGGGGGVGGKGWSRFHCGRSRDVIRGEGGGGVFGKSPVSPLLALCRSFTRKAQSIFFFAYNLIITIIW